ncbi:MAG TPA: hypothetical protein VJ836_03905 [Candidatus Saccharimonadales bacterium]|nr:hypothetical protein [Candidatus Saccharimonadales bacterium]
MGIVRVAEELQDSPVFLEQVAALGRFVLSEDSVLDDLQERAIAFSDGVYPTVEAAIEAEKVRTNSAVPLGKTATALALRVLGGLLPMAASWHFWKVKWPRLSAEYSQ